MEPTYIHDDDRSAILNKAPDEWSEQDVANLCRRFSDYCDSPEATLDQLLVKLLWRYWFLIHGDEPLMAEPRHNIALMLNAQALDEFVPPPGDADFFARYRRDHAELERSLSAPQLTWGPRAELSTISGPTLESPAVHVCVSRSGGLIREILMTGQGLPELRQEILQAMLSCMLRVQAGDLDMLNVDAYRIVAPTANQDLLELPGITMLGSGSTRPPSNDQRAADALSEIVQRLVLLQNQTEMVQVQECDATTKQDFDAGLRNYAKEAHEKKLVTVIAKEGPQMAGVITFAPYSQIARRPSPLRMILDPAVIELPSFEQLLQAFTHCTVERITAAAEVRQKTYEERAVDLSMEHERWRDANERTRKEMWPEFVWLSELFNEETATIIRLAQPKRVSTSDYMENNVPYLIQQFEDWARRMRQIVENITDATSRPDTPIKRLAASRFLDAALRDRGHLIDDVSTRRCFDRWSAQVAPLIRFNWRKILKAKAIDANSLTRNLVFHTRFQVDEMHNVIGLVTQPLAMISPTSSLLEFDYSKPVLMVHSPHDYALAYDATAGLDANQAWSDVKSAANKDREEFSTRFRSALSQAPFELLPKLIREIESIKDHGKDRQLDREDLKRKRAEIIEQFRLVGFPSKIMTLLSHRAFHSARELITEVRVPERLKVRLLLWQVLVECLAHDENPNEYLPGFIGNRWRPVGLRTNDGSIEIAQLLSEAQSRDSHFVQQWIDCLRNSEELRSALDLLRRDWLRLEDVISTPEERTLIDFFTAIESVVLAKQLEKAATDISADGESAITLLTKVGQLLEDLLLTDLAATPVSDVTSLLEILAGTQITSDRTPE